jgi:hypothetical protein
VILLEGMGCAENILRAGNIYPLNFENPLTRNAFILAPLAIITFQVRKPPILILTVAEKLYEKIPSQYERHERQHKQRPITIAVYFWRGFATHEEKAKDTIAQFHRGRPTDGIEYATRESSRRASAVANGACQRRDIQRRDITRR